VPAGSHKLHVTVEAGDRIAVSLTVNGKDVRIALRNLTRGDGLAFTRRMSSPDTTSADWIVEAPSLCTTSGRCAGIGFSVSYGQAGVTSSAATARLLDATRR
jgi:hypothetical protein